MKYNKDFVNKAIKDGAVCGFEAIAFARKASKYASKYYTIKDRQELRGIRYISNGRSYIFTFLDADEGLVVSIMEWKLHHKFIFKKALLYEPADDKAMEK